MPEENENLEKKHEKVGDAFRYYRERGIIFINTIIVFSSGVLGWVAASKNYIVPNDICWKTVFFFFGLLPLGLAVVSGILVQFLIFIGYRFQAYHLLAKYWADITLSDTEKSEEIKAKEATGYAATANSFFEQSNKRFTPAEIISCINLILFLLGFITIFIFLSINFFQSTT